MHFEVLFRTYSARCSGWKFLIHAKDLRVRADPCSLNSSRMELLSVLIQLGVLARSLVCARVGLHCGERVTVLRHCGLSRVRVVIV